MEPKAKETTEDGNKAEAPLLGVDVNLMNGDVTEAGTGSKIRNLNLLPPDTPEIAAQRIKELASLKAVAKIDFSKPFAVVVDQTESRTNTSIILGDSVEEVLAKAQAEAEAVTMRTGRPCAFFGPQEGVMMPPEKPVALSLKFKEPTRSAVPTGEA